MLDGCGSAGFFSGPPTPHAPCDVEAAYTQALHAASDMRLLRLVMKTGPCWGALAPPTAEGLLGAFVRCVRDGVMLHRVLPWLWRLADEGEVGRPEVGAEGRRQLLEALGSCLAAEDVQVGGLGGAAMLCQTWGFVWCREK
jgi:hypothetical protein